MGLSPDRPSRYARDLTITIDVDLDGVERELTITGHFVPSDAAGHFAEDFSAEMDGKPLTAEQYGLISEADQHRIYDELNALWDSDRRLY